MLENFDYNLTLVIKKKGSGTVQDNKSYFQLFYN